MDRRHVHNVNANQKGGHQDALVAVGTQANTDEKEDRKQKDKRREIDE